MNKTRINIWLMVVASTFFWGSNFNAGHAIANDVPPLTAAAERFSSAFIVFWLLRFLFGQAESTLNLRDIWILLALGIIGVFGFNYAFFTALHTTSALNAALIMALSPMLSLLFSAWLLNTNIKAYQYTGMSIAFLGVILVVTGGKVSELQVAIGDVWMCLACTVWSFFNVGAKKFANHIPALQFARWTVSVGAIALVIAALILEQPLTTLQHLPLSAHILLLYMAIFGTVMAYIFWLKGVYFLGPDKSSIAFNLMPIFTLLISLALGIYPNTMQIMGIVVVLAGVLLSMGYNPQKKT